MDHCFGYVQSTATRVPVVKTLCVAFHGRHLQGKIGRGDNLVIKIFGATRREGNPGAILKNEYH